MCLQVPNSLHFAPRSFADEEVKLVAKSGFTRKTKPGG
jgi:hypothetical protein